MQNGRIAKLLAFTSSFLLAHSGFLFLHFDFWFCDTHPNGLHAPARGFVAAERNRHIAGFGKIAFAGCLHKILF